MQYQHFSQLQALVDEKLITKRDHLRLPISIYNYSAAAQFLPISQWTEAMKDCRGLILDKSGNIVARPFRKFWNYEQVLDQIPVGENFSVWEKVDGSLGIVTVWDGNLVVATRGSFESDQARWAQAHLKDISAIQENLTYLFEIIFPENRIVVDYGDRQDMPLLAVMDKYGNDDYAAFQSWPASKATLYDGLTDIEKLAAMDDKKGEGFVIRWDSGFRAKVKFEEYKRLHRLITQCSTRTIWELLRSGKDTAELLDRVPKEFESWVTSQISDLTERHDYLIGYAHHRLATAPKSISRKEFSEYAKKTDQPGLLFALLDQKPIEDMCWRLVEPKWATPFRKDTEA